MGLLAGLFFLLVDACLFRQAFCFLKGSVQKPWVEEKARLRATRPPGA